MNPISRVLNVLLTIGALALLYYFVVVQAAKVDAEHHPNHQYFNKDADPANYDFWGRKIH